LIYTWIDFAGWASLTETWLASFIIDDLYLLLPELKNADRNEVGAAIAVGAETVEMCDVTVAKTLNPITHTVDVASPASVLVHTFSR
jgi:hypothetical protein